MNKMKPIKEEFERIKTALKLIKDFKVLEIKESWIYDIDRLEDEIKEKQKFLRVVKRERKSQPSVNSISVITKEKFITKAGYQIGITKDNRIIYCKDW